MSEVLGILKGSALVTSGFSLAALTVAGYVLHKRRTHLEKIAAINKGDATALQLVNGTLTAFNVDPAHYSKKDAAEFVKLELARLARRELYGALGAGLVALLLFVIVIVAILAPEPRRVTAELYREMRTGTPAARAEAIRHLVAAGVSQSEILRHVGEAMLAGSGVELCNLMLASAALSDPPSVSAAPSSVADSPEHQLQNPVCTSINKPDFKDAKVEKVAFVRPQFVTADFTRGRFDEAVLRDDPDYSGKENSECQIAQTSFDGATFKNSAFEGCKMSQVGFNSAVLNKVNFHRTVLDRADLRFVQATDLRFLGGHLKHVDLRDLKGTIKFALNPYGGHIRMDFALAKQLGSLPSGFQAAVCVSTLDANRCWDLVSQDVPECQALAGPKTYLVTSEQSLPACKSWVAEAAKAGK
ncbi:pentapeptide repeat-containing protein [Ideonella sp. YS5]|uniref:pentapeptide repeat-containing protein n=1 Tax=Ideonella sp. YS5 TaxID=3453714 RepID=UPI003EE8B63E